MGSCVLFCCPNKLFFRSGCGKDSPCMVSALGFRCCRVIPLANQKLTFDCSIERIRWITRDNFHRKVIDQFYCKLLLSSDIVKTEAIVVEPFKWKRVSLYSSIRLLIEKDLFSLSAALPRDPFHSLANNRGHQCCKWIFRMHWLSHSTRIRYYQ